MTEQEVQEVQRDMQFVCDGVRKGELSVEARVVYERLRAYGREQHWALEEIPMPWVEFAYWSFAYIAAERRRKT
jgi:hypothetical protein